VNKAYRTLLAGVLSLVFLGPALGQEPGAAARGSERGDGRGRSPGDAVPHSVSAADAAVVYPDPRSHDERSA
jgi:hypothetical protein